MIPTSLEQLKFENPVATVCTFGNCAHLVRRFRMILKIHADYLAVFDTAHFEYHTYLLFQQIHN
jgi:hypothetical protein